MNYNFTINQIPPSWNKFAGRQNCWEYRQEKERWEWIVICAVVKPPRVPMKHATVTISYYFPDMRRRDPDNYAGKFLLDGLVRAGVIADDSFGCIALELRAECDKNNPRVEIEVENA